MTAGIVALIRSEGAVVLIAKNFRDVLDTYKRTPELTFEGGPDGLKINITYFRTSRQTRCPSALRTWIRPFARIGIVQHRPSTTWVAATSL